MANWIYGTATNFSTGNPPTNPPPTSCLIGNNNAYDHAWPMLIHFGLYDSYNCGCQPTMYYLSCGQTGTSVYNSSTGIQINYVRTVDLGPDLCSFCNNFVPKLLIDLKPAAFTALGVPLSRGVQSVYVYQP